MKIVTLLLVIIINTLSYSQIIATTAKGDTVLLNKDGTWEFKTEYLKKNLNIKTVLDTNSTLFFKDSLSQQVVKGQKVDYQLWYNPDNWKLANLNNSSAEYSLQYTKGPAYCLIIPEKISLTMEDLKNVAIVNAEKVGKNIEVVKEDVRKVNGTYVFMMELKGLIQGIRFVYYGYYYAGKDETIQLITYTYQSEFEEYKTELEKMLNGLVINKTAPNHQPRPTAKSAQ